MIYICWEDTDTEFQSWHYAGEGVFEPKFNQKVVIRKALWSKETTKEMEERAKEWIKNQRPLGWLEITEE
jgi:hypothetical protein